MTLFSYRAIDKNNRIIDGSIGSKSSQEAADLLRKKGLRPLKIKKSTKITRSKGSLPMIEKITFCRYMSSMINSGLSLSEGVEVLQQETSNNVMKKILSDVTYSLERGQQLSNVFVKYPDVFDNFFLTMIKTGEVSGDLGKVFSYLEKGLKAEYNLVQKVKGALLYPLVVFSAMFGIGLLMLFVVLPQIGKVFIDMKLPLFPATRILFEVSILLSSNIIPTLFVGVIFGVFLLFYLTRKKGKRMLLSIISLMPFVRDLIKRVGLARFTRTFSTLVASAVPISESIEISGMVFTLSKYIKSTETIKKDIIEGKSLSASFKKQRVFPPLLIQMIAAGEKTGTLDSSLGDLAQFYEQKVEEDVKNLTQILEPILILIVGVSVGIMVLSIIAPIYTVVSTLQEQLV